MSTLHEAFTQLLRLKQERTVWLEVAEFLSKFVDDDTREATTAIDTEDSGQVPQKIISDIVKSINKEKLVPLNETIEQFSNIQIDLEVSNGDKNQSKTKDSKVQQKVQGKSLTRTGDGSRSSAVIRGASHANKPAQPSDTDNADQRSKTG